MWARRFRCWCSHRGYWIWYRRCTATFVSGNLLSWPVTFPKKSRYFEQHGCDSRRHTRGYLSWNSSHGICLDYLRDIILPGSESGGNFNEGEGDGRCDRTNSPWLQVSSWKRDLIFTPAQWGKDTCRRSLIRGGFYNLSLNNRQEDFARSVFEGVAYNSKWLLKCVESFVGRSLDDIHVIGGGAQSDFGVRFTPMCWIGEWSKWNFEHANARGAAWIAAC